MIERQIYALGLSFQSQNDDGGTKKSFLSRQTG